MIGRSRLALAAVLVVAVVVTGLVARRFGSPPAASWPRDLLPSAGLLVALDGEGFGSLLSRLEAFPGYRFFSVAAKGSAGTRRIGWRGEVPPFSFLLGVRGCGALGLYREGWVAVSADDGTEPALPGARMVGGWRIVGSSPRLLHGAPLGATLERSPEPEALRIRFDVGEWAALRRRSSAAASGAVRWLPSAAEGRLRPSSHTLDEHWILRGTSDSALEWLDPRPDPAAPLAGWGAMPQRPLALLWMRLDATRLRAGLPRDSTSAASAIERRLDGVEALLGVAVREEIAASLAGPVGVARLEDPEGDPSRILLAADLSDPHRAARALDRIAALGVLSGSVNASSYRGVGVASWSRGARTGALEPSAAVDGNVLLVAFRRVDIEDAIDRRRSAGAPASQLAKLPPGSWKAWSRSLELDADWESWIGIPPQRPPRERHDVRAVLRTERGVWILEGRGGAPALFADPLIPALRRIARRLGTTQSI